MCLLGDVCLIENEKLALPTDGTIERSSTFEVREYGDHYCCSS